MSAYLWTMLLGSLLVFALYGLYCARGTSLRRPWLTAGLSLLFAVLFGVVLSRVGYALLMQELDFEYDGIAALEYLLEFEIDRVSFFCGAVGAVLGVLLANRLARKGSVLPGMDAFAPFGALLTALFRLGEIFHGSYGAGATLEEGSPFAFFPFALQIHPDGNYVTYAWAVCVLSALFALVWAAVSFFRLRGTRAGLNLTASLFFLALPQVLCESLRKSGMYWLFVHVEQLLCAVVLLAVMLFWVLRSGRSLPFPRRWAPVGILLLGAALLVGTEFAIDGKILNITKPVCYGIMCVILVGIGAAGALAADRWNREKTPGKA